MFKQKEKAVIDSVNDNLVLNINNSNNLSEANNNGNAPNFMNPTSVMRIPTSKSSEISACKLNNNNSFLIGKGVHVTTNLSDKSGVPFTKPQSVTSYGLQFENSASTSTDIYNTLGTGSYNPASTESVFTSTKRIFNMKHNFSVFILLFLSLNMWAIKKSDKDKIYQTMQRVADWQIAHQEEEMQNAIYKNSYTYNGWATGAMYLGILEWAKMYKDDTYFQYLKSCGEKVNFKPGSDIFHADDICASQLFIELFKKYQDSAMIKPTHERMNFILKNRSHGDLDFMRNGNQMRWSWCDALFMAPAAYIRAANVLGDKRFLNFMDEEFLATYDSLYVPSQKLFFRDTRYKTMREANGQPVFWGRGNGWVIGGLCMIIDNLPENHPTRGFYIDLFQKMMKRIAGLQDKNGFWHPSLLDYESYPMPETSGSGFFTYGLCWGINHGYLPAQKYKPIAVKGWNALVSAVHSDGKLGWVQPIGADPKMVTADMTENYGVGAFLFAGSEMYKMK